MTLFQSLGASPSQAAEDFGHVLSLFGAIGDYALGNSVTFGPRIGSLAAALGELAGCSSQDCKTIQIAGVLHGIGAVGNRGLRKKDPLAPRAAMMEQWNIPAAGALRCEQITGLPQDTAHIIRWHAEAWDGTGYPDQLRWHGIPKAAQYLHLAQTFVEGEEPEDSLCEIQELSGRVFSPDEVRTFVAWFHTFGGEVEMREFPFDILSPAEDSIDAILRQVSEAVDLHNGTPGRAARITQRAKDTAHLLELSTEATRLLEVTAHLFGTGEMAAEELEWHRFDPLSGLGRELRATNAIVCAGILAPLPGFAPLAPILRARGEWFDGSGLPDHLRGEAIPIQARILSVCIAHDALDEARRTSIRDDRTTPLERMEKAGGSQFDPAVVRAYTECRKVKA